MPLSYNFHTSFSLYYAITGQTLKATAHPHIELCFLKVTHLEVCGTHASVLYIIILLVACSAKTDNVTQWLHEKQKPFKLVVVVE